MSGQNNETPEAGPETFFQRLIKRHVIQSAAIYVAVAWGALEILITVQEKLGWPPMISTWATRLFVAGFPIAIILAWRRDVQNRTARLAMGVAAVVAAGVALFLTLSTGPVQRAAPPTVDPVNTAIATVAVLAFENANGKAENDYLASGFTSELIGRLSKHPDLAIIQEESLRSPSLLNLVASAQASELRADYLVQGKVLKERGFVEVTASLENLEGGVLWSEILREPYSADGVIALQRRISGEISRVLGTRLDAQVYCGETSDLDAMELYYRGRGMVGTRSVPSVLEGVELLKRAVDKDPYFGRAYSVYGGAKLYLSNRLRHEDRQQAALDHQMGLEAFRRAVDICPTIGMAYKIVVPPYEGIDNEYVDQELQWRDALAMDPNDAAMLRQYFYHLMGAGMLDEALESMQRAYDIEPLLAMIPAQYAQALTKVGRCDEAMEMAVEAEALGGSPSAVTALPCAKRSGDAEAMAAALNVLVESLGLPDPAATLGVTPIELTRALLDPDHPARPQVARGLYDVWAKNPDFRANNHVYWMIDMATMIGELDLVFDVLEGAVEACGMLYCYTVAWSPLFEVAEASSRLRSDPRFVELMSRTELPGYWREFGWPNGCAPDGDSFRCF